MRFIDKITKITALQILKAYLIPALASSKKSESVYAAEYNFNSLIQTSCEGFKSNWIRSKVVMGCLKYIILVTRSDFDFVRSIFLRNHLMKSREHHVIKGHRSTLRR